MVQPTKHSQAIEDYVKAVYTLTERGGRASGTALAEQLGVSHASVTAMLKRLAELGLVEREPYRGAELTARGRLLALEIVRHHRLLELFLHDTLGLPWDEVHAEAEVLEHHLSDVLERAIARKLGDPQYDPHGHPIPAVDGTLPEISTRPLAQLGLGQEAQIRSVHDADPAVLRHLTQLGLGIGSHITIEDEAPFGGSLVIVSDGGARHSIGRELAELIHVEVPVSV